MFTHSGLAPCLALSLSFSVLACAPQQVPNNALDLAKPSITPSAVTGTLPSATPSTAAPQKQSSDFQDFVTQAIGLQASLIQNQTSPSSPLPIKDYPLPRGLKLSEIQIEKVLLDGKLIPVENLQLSLDPQGNLIFLLKAAKNLISEVSDLSDITQSSLFQQRQTALQDRLLEEQAPPPPTTVPKPSFLQARVRGEQLTRQQMATLSAGAGELAKSGTYLDRQFSVILSVRNQSFVVAQAAPRFLLLGFELRGEMIQQWLAQPISPTPGIDVLPLIVRSDQKDLISEVPDVTAGMQRVEKILHEQLLSLILGPETQNLKGSEIKNYRDFDVRLPEQLWQDIQTKVPGNSLETAQVAPALTQLLANSASQIQALQGRFQAHGRTALSDQALYNAVPEVTPPFLIKRLPSEQLQQASSSCAGAFSTQSLPCQSPDEK